MQGSRSLIGPTNAKVPSSSSHTRGNIMVSRTQLEQLLSRNPGDPVFMCGSRDHLLAVTCSYRQEHASSTKEEMEQRPAYVKRFWKERTEAWATH